MSVGTTARRFAVVTDSTADLPDGEFERLAVHQVPLRVIWDGVSYRDKIDLSTAAFYERLALSSSLPTTAAPAVGEFESLYKDLLSRHEGILSVHLGSAFSSTLSVAQTAAQRVGGDRIVVLDSSTTTMCLGWAAREAALLADRGVALADAATHLRQMFPALRLVAAIDTLEYLQRGGRIGRVQALAGALLRVKPIVEVRDGQVLPIERVRTHGVALRRLVDLAVALPRVARLGVLHGAAPDAARELQELLQSRFPALPLETSEIGIVVGTHAGPGCVGFTALIGDGA